MTARTASRWPDLALTLILALLPLLFFWRLITPNPADQMQLAAGDFTEQYFPLRAFTAQQWVRGQIPFWNPYLYGGQPALADIQSGALYPPHVIQALVLGWGGPFFLGQEPGFPLEALQWQVILHFSWAAVGTFFFVRHLAQRYGRPLKQARFGGVVASIVFTYGGYLTGFPVQQITILAVSAWLPWVLWGLSVALTRARFFEATASVVWTALALAMAILAGHPQTVLYIFYLSLAYTIFYAIFTKKVTPSCHFKAESREIPQMAGGKQRFGWISRSFVARNDMPEQLHKSDSQSGPNNARSLASRLSLSLSLWLLIVLLGVALSAAQLLPTLEFIARSLRADLSYQAVSAGLPLTELVAILYPGFFGGSPEYVGIGTLVLIALALILGRPRAELFFWAGAALVSLLLAFGGRLFVYPLFYLLAPGFDMVRQQERAFLIYSFSAALLAGFGAIVLISPLSKAARSTFTRFERRLRQVGLAALAMTAFFIYGSTAAAARGDEVNLFFGVLRHHLFGLLFFGGMILLLRLRPRRRLRRWWGMSLIAFWLALNLFTVNWQFNLQKPEIPPLFTPNETIRFLQTNLPISQSLNLHLGRIASGGLLPGGNSAASVYNLQDITGNTPLQLAQVDAFLQQMPAWRLWQLMNVRYVLDQRDIADAGLSLVFEEGGLKVFKMEDPFNRAWFVSEVEVVPATNQAIARLSADDFDLRRAAILAEPVDASLDEASDSTVEIVKFEANTLTLDVEATGRHLLVISQIYYPGWRVTIDDRPADLLPVNIIFQGVVVPAGQHQIQVTFWPTSFTVGAIISVVGLIVCVVLLGGRSTLPSFLSTSPKV